MTWIESAERVYREFARTRFPLPSAQQLDNFEAKHSMNLPRSYRDFLLRFGGGSFRPSPLVWVPSLSRVASLDAMYCIEASYKGGELEDSIGVFDEGPDEILVIGNTSGGHLFLLVTDSSHDDYGAVLYRTYEESHELCKDIWGGVALTEPNVKIDPETGELIEPWSPLE